MELHIKGERLVAFFVHIRKRQLFVGNGEYITLLVCADMTAAVLESMTLALAGVCYDFQCVEPRFTGCFGTIRVCI